MQTIEALVKEEIANAIGRGLGKIAGAEDSRFTEYARNIQDLQSQLAALESTLNNYDIPTLVKGLTSAFEAVNRVSVQNEVFGNRLKALDDRVTKLEELLTL